MFRYYDHPSRVLDELEKTDLDIGVLLQGSSTDSAISSTARTTRSSPTVSTPSCETTSSASRRSAPTVVSDTTGACASVVSTPRPLAAAAGRSVSPRRRVVKEERKKQTSGPLWRPGNLVGRTHNTHKALGRGYDKTVHLLLLPILDFIASLLCGVGLASYMARVVWKFFLRQQSSSSLAIELVHGVKPVSLSTKRNCGIENGIMKTQAGFCVSLVIVTCLVAPWLDYFVLAWRMACVSASALVLRMCFITGAAFLSRLENSFSSPNCCPTGRASLACLERPHQTERRRAMIVERVRMCARVRACLNQLPVALNRPNGQGI